MNRPALLSALVVVLACARDGAPKAGSAAPVGAATPKPDSASAATAASSKLAGTHWRLVEIQSMDDKQGKTQPPDKSKYTLSFDGGLAALRLDCNRGSGPYDDKPSGDGGGGSLTIGPLAVTRAFCPPPSLGDRIARDMGYVRSYRVANGQLALSLMADGGIYIWEPDPAAR